MCGDRGARVERRGSRGPVGAFGGGDRDSGRVSGGRLSAAVVVAR